MSWNLRDVTGLWRFNARPDGNLDVVVLLRRRSESGMNNFVLEDASVIKERVVQRPQTCTWPPRSPDLTACDFFLWGFIKDNVYVQPLPKTLQELRECINTAIGTCLGGFGGNGSIAWTSTLSQVGRTSNVFKVTMKLQTFLFKMVVTSCISVQYL